MLTLFLLASFVYLVRVTFSAWGNREGEGVKPNIVVCTCDQLRAFETGCYGNDVIRTPHVDRLAAEGVRFETAVTNYPVCMAARSVLLSGQHNRTCTGGVANVAFPSRPGEHNMPEYPDAGRPHLPDTTLPEALSGLGYHTATIGKWHIHSWPQDIGFDHYLIPRVHHCHSGQSFTEDGGEEFVPDGYSVDFEADRVEQFLAGRANQDDPFFLYYNISPPHCPVADAPDLYRTMYAPGDIPLRPNVDLTRPLKDQEHWFKVYRYDFRYYMLHLPYTERLPDHYGLRELIAEYYGMTTWMDAAVGRLLAALEANGLTRDTIVVFTSDHGDNLGSHGLVQKGGPNEEAVRIPLLVRWPGHVPAGHVVRDRVASLVDIMPTVIDGVGGTVPGHVQGRSLLPSLQGELAQDEDPGAVIETGGGAAIRTCRHMYAVPWGAKKGVLADRGTEFFDLVQDPYETRNLADTDEQAGTAARLDAALRSWDAGTAWMPTPDV